MIRNLGRLLARNHPDYRDYSHWLAETIKIHLRLIQQLPAQTVPVLSFLKERNRQYVRFQCATP